MPSAPHVPVGESTLVIRVATRYDDAELRNLAALDSARPLAGSVIVAESDGRIDAALSLDDGRAIADPFRPTAGLVDAGQLRPVIDRTYPLSETVAALRRVDAGHAVGKVVVAVAV